MNAHVTRPAAVLWDMDGTLIDSEPYWIEAETGLALQHGVQWTHEDGLAMVGNPLEVTGKALRDRGITMPAEDIVDHLLRSVTEQVRRHVPWQDDARELLDEVVEAGIPCALVTMSYRMLADAMLDQLPGVFSVVVTGDSVTHGKPHPEAYLTAASELGVDITQCVAIEDSPAGTQSGHASGAATLAVQREAAVAPLPGMSRVTSLSGIGVDGLTRIVNGGMIDHLSTLNSLPSLTPKASVARRASRAGGVPPNSGQCS